MAKQHPQGETPAEAIERVAPTPATLSFSGAAAGDNADAAAAREAYKTFILALREAGFAPTGALSGSTAPVRGDDGEIVPGSETTFHDAAAEIA